jgi:predicted nucleic acid-binding protein
VFYIEANVLIGAFEQKLGDPALVPFLLSRHRSVTMLTSEVTLSEVLVGPLRRRDSRLLQFYHDLFAAPDVLRVIPVTRSIIERSAALRSQSPMKLPDAIHVATAEASGCNSILSSDKRLHVPFGMKRIDPFEQAFEHWTSKIL